MQYEAFAELATTRINVSPRRLVAPGPQEAQLDALLSLAAAAPDHGQLAPWRFVLVSAAARQRLGEAFGCALKERDPLASNEDITKAIEKAHRAPMVLTAIVRLAGKQDIGIPALEHAVSFGAAIQNVLLGAHAMGFGAGLTSGKAMWSQAVRDLFELDPHEHAVCCINIGTIAKAHPPRGNRRKPAEILRVLGAAQP